MLLLRAQSIKAYSREGVRKNVNSRNSVYSYVTKKRWDVSKELINRLRQGKLREITECLLTRFHKSRWKYFCKFGIFLTNLMKNGIGQSKYRNYSLFNPCSSFQ